jgi:hypothetical protein
MGGVSESIFIHVMATILLMGEMVSEKRQCDGLLPLQIISHVRSKMKRNWSLVQVDYLLSESSLIRMLKASPPTHTRHER